MSQLKILIVCLFIVALGTGILVGMGVSKTTSPPAVKTPTTGPRGSSLIAALSLTPQQSSQIQPIWDDWNSTREASRQARSDRYTQLQKERDEAVQALFTDTQKTAYDDIQKKYHQQRDQLDEEGHEAFLAAVEKTKTFLTESQRTKYDEILKNGPSGRGGRGWDRGGGGRGASSRRAPGATQPASATTQQF